MAELPEAGAKLTLDLSEWESNWSSAMDNADTLTQALDDISGSVDVEINLDVPDVTEFDEITALDGETITPELDTTESETSKEIRDGINFLATVEKIKIAIDVVGTALQFVKDIGMMVVTPFLDVEDAVARINAQTGGTGIEDLGQFIRDIQAADLGDSVEQISDVVVAAKQLNAPIDEAARASLTFTKVFDDQDPVTVMTTLKTMSDEFKTSITEAGDLMTVAFQQGMNKGGDLMNVVTANASSWADMGLNETQAFSILDSLMDNSVDSATDAAKMIQTLDDALTTAADNADSPQAEALKTLGMENPKDSGEAMGADFIDGFAGSFANLPSDKQDLISGVLFGKGGKKFTGALEGLTTEGGPFADVVNAATDAATEIDNSLRGAIDDFILEVNTALTELLSSSNIDLPGKIAALKEGLQEAVDVIASGGTIGEALEVGLNIPGLEDTLNTFIGNFERIIGNLEITFLQIVALIQDIAGQGEAAKATRQTIFDRSLGQLEFDLQLANPEEVDDMLKQAASRGLNATNMKGAIDTALNESIANGDFDQGSAIIQGLIDSAVKTGNPAAWNGLAADYVTKLDGAFDNALAAGNLDLAQKLIAIDPNAKIPGLDEAVTGMQKQLADAFAPKAGSGAPSMFGGMANPFSQLPDMLKGAGSNPFANISTLFPGIEGAKKEVADGKSFLEDMVAGVDESVATMTEGSETAGIALDHIATTADTMATSVGTSLDTVNTAFDTTAVEAAMMDQGIVLSLTGNTVTTAFEEVATAADSAFPGVIAWFEKTTAEAAAFDVGVSGHIQHILNLLHDLQFLSAQVATGVQAALTLGAGLGGGGNVTNNSVVVNNNVNGNAAAAANGYAIGASLRPGGGG